MGIKELFRIALTLLFIFVIAGCGSVGSDNNGSLTLVNTSSDLGGGVQHIVSTATINAGKTTVADGGNRFDQMKINFTGKQFRKDGSIITTVSPEGKTPNPEGVAVAQFNVVGDSTEITYFEITASVDNLFAAETISIPIAP